MTRIAKEVAPLFVVFVTMAFLAFAQPAFSAPSKSVQEDCVQTSDREKASEQEEHHVWGAD